MKYKRLLSLFLVFAMSLVALCGCEKGLDPKVDNILTTEEGLSYYESDKIKVMSQNIHHANAESPNSLNERAKRFEEILPKYDADVIGMQELRPGWESTFIFDIFPEYECEKFYRSSQVQEGLFIFWKADKLELVESGMFWFSDTPDEESPTFHVSQEEIDAGNANRITAWVKLKVIKTGKEFYYFNTHLHNADESHMASVELLIEKAKEICGDTPMYMSGDLNIVAPEFSTATPNEIASHEKLLTYFDDLAQLFGKEKEGTFPSYGKNLAADRVNPRIDYFFTPKNGKAIPMSYQVMTDTVDGFYCSDHYGVVAEIIMT
ncbi:MAG: endonuclease/exonuclease/phosphatase family protein [Clostridia bacterium]|nr:endonuclease/exonuclease/phosphatase family protein [Clostridia bacterium]